MANGPLVAVPAMGGMVAAGPKATSPLGAWAEVFNMDYTGAGTLIKRLGFTKYISGQFSLATGFLGTFRALAPFTRVSTGRAMTTDILAVVSESTTPQCAILKDDLDGTWDTLQANWGTSERPACITIAEGYAVITNGVSTPQKYDQTTLSDLGASAPVADAFGYHLRRLWGVGASGGSTVTYSTEADITSWTGGDSDDFTLDSGDGDYVVGVSAPLDGKLYFFKGPNVGSVFELSGRTPSTFTNNRITSGLPCAGHNSIITTADDVYWMSVHGIHSLRALRSGDSFISRPIQFFWDGLVKTNIIPSTFNPIVYGWHNPSRNQVGWVIRAGSSSGWNVTGGYPDIAIVYHYATRKWAFYGFDFKADDETSVITCATAVPINGVYRTFFGTTQGIAMYAGSDTGFADGNTASGTTAGYSSYGETPVFYSFPGAGAERYKQFNQIGVVGSGNNVALSATVYQEMDTSGTSYTLPATLGTSALRPQSAHILVEGMGRWASVRFESTGTTNFSLDGYYILADPGGEGTNLYGGS